MGPIGLELTGVLAQLFMVWWDRELGDRLARIGLKLWTYKCYVDDINNIMTPPKLQLRFHSDTLIEDEKSVEEDQALDAAGVENIVDHWSPKIFYAGRKN